MQADKKKILSSETGKGTSKSWILVVIRYTEGTKLTKGEKVNFGQAQKCQYTEKHLYVGEEPGLSWNRNNSVQ